MTHKHVKNCDGTDGTRRLGLPEKTTVLVKRKRKSIECAVTVGSLPGYLRGLNNKGQKTSLQVCIGCRLVNNSVD